MIWKPSSFPEKIINTHTELWQSLGMTLLRAEVFLLSQGGPYVRPQHEMFVRRSCKSLKYRQTSRSGAGEALDPPFFATYPLDRSQNAVGAQLFEEQRRAARHRFAGGFHPSL